MKFKSNPKSTSKSIWKLEIEIKNRKSEAEIDIEIEIKAKSYQPQSNTNLYRSDIEPNHIKIKLESHIAAWLLLLCDQHNHAELHPEETGNAYRCMAAVVLKSTTPC